MENAMPRIADERTREVALVSDALSLPMHAYYGDSHVSARRELSLSTARWRFGAMRWKD
jgi:hypothetical protein